MITRGYKEGIHSNDAAHNIILRGNRFEYIEPAKVGDRITATGRVADVYEKTGSSGSLLFIIFETEYVNQHGRPVARLRGTAIRR